jgi:UDP-N-acetylmuramoyl-L-alanyl-D-glutamate--2,6-diaminopimelate ligase
MFGSLSGLSGLVEAEAAITGIALDSRKVQPGEVFVALRGGSVDGHRYLAQALERGAAALVIEAGMESALPPGCIVPVLRAANTRLALAQLSAVFYDHPARQMVMIGVTGTDGKTTTSSLIYNILQTAGLPAGMISTVSARIGNQQLDTGFHVTTPEAPDVQRYLAQMRAAGVTHVVLEATSHGLEQRRVDGCEFDCAVVTNITHEHLDYHGSYTAYRRAKGRLFESLGETAAKPFAQPGVAVLNRDDGSYDYLASITPPGTRQIRYGYHAAAEIRPAEVESGPAGIAFTALGLGRPLRISSRLSGAYNVSNCLAALAVTAGGLGVEPQAAGAGIALLEGIPGRMERIELGQDFTAMVDFAHTPNALLRALQAARTLTAGRVIAVFGSAGLRDREKRRLMAETAAGLADLFILTAEDPRTESLAGILAAMAAGAASRGAIEGQRFWRVADRGEALRMAVRLAKPGDLVISLGKGHEQSMCFGETEYPWDDRVALRAALSELLGLPGPEMPYLPTGEAI